MNEALAGIEWLCTHAEGRSRFARDKSSFPGCLRHVEGHLAQGRLFGMAKVTGEKEEGHRVAENV